MNEEICNKLILNVSSCVGWHSVVGIAPCYELDCPGIESGWRPIYRRAWRKSGAIPLLPLWAFMDCSRAKFTFTLTCCIVPIMDSVAFSWRFASKSFHNFCSQTHARTHTHHFTYHVSRDLLWNKGSTLLRSARLTYWVRPLCFSVLLVK